MNEAGCQTSFNVSLQPDWWYHLLSYQYNVLGCSWGSLRLDKPTKLTDQEMGLPSGQFQTNGVDPLTHSLQVLIWSESFQKYGLAALLLPSKAISVDFFPPSSLRIARC